MMMAFTYLPAFVMAYFKDMPGVWKSHHQLMLCWLIFMQAIHPGRKTFWTDGKRLCLCHVGDVTLVLSKKGRNVDPKNTKIWGTNLPELTPRDVVSLYQKR
jgi:hypothetical protein